MTNFLERLYALLWGPPMLVLIFVVGLWLSVCTRFVQIRLLGQAIRRFLSLFSPKNSSQASAFQALCTALAATVGTGNLVGVAGAICLGGPGAVFWMLIFAFFGMAVKYAEATLAVRYSRRSGQETVGGTMYMIRFGLPKWLHPLAYGFCLFGFLASFGIGNLAQVNAAVTSIRSVSDSFSPLLLGVILAVLVGLSFLRGANSIGGIAQVLVPAAAGVYIVLCLILLICNAEAIPSVIISIVQGAFSPKAVTGGIIGSTIRSVQTGCSRGIFSNEAGMGTASIAHGAAQVAHPVEQGMMGLLEVFLDTVVVCTLTALVILCSGIPIPYSLDAGAELATSAFSTFYGGYGKIIVAAFLSCFSYATILGWSLYGLRCSQFLFGQKSAPVFFLLQTVTVVFGAVLNAPIVWRLSEILNGLMTLPNLLTLTLLSPELIRLTNSYPKKAHQAVRSDRDALSLP